MATQKITLKRVINTSGGTDVLYPTTTIDQIFTVDGSGDITSTSLSSYLGATYIPLTQKGASNGVATLGSDSKIPASQLPSSVIGGMKFTGTVTGSVSIDDITGTGLNEINAAGEYLVCTGGVSLTQGSTVTGTVQAPGDEGDSTLPIALEAGDWIVATTDLSGNAISIAIINNTYRNATTSDYGIVQLSNISAVNASTSGNQVITQEILGNLIGTSADTIAAGNHTHDSRYYTETEVGNFFSGSTSITGYNKANWDTAYGWGDHGAAGYQSATNSQSVTLTGAVTGTGTITNFGNVSIATTATSDPTLTLSGDATGSATFTNLGNATLEVAIANDSHTHDGRYYTESEFNNWLDGTAIDGHNFTEIKYGPNPTGTVVGTILIDID